MPGMAQRKGRPPAPNPKKRVVNTRLDEGLYNAVEAYRQKRGLESIAVAMRELVRLGIQKGGQ